MIDDKDKWKPTNNAGTPPRPCIRCGSVVTWYRVVESSCGGYTDVQYHCRTCDHKWWVEGPDA